MLNRSTTLRLVGIAAAFAVVAVPASWAQSPDRLDGHADGLRESEMADPYEQPELKGYSGTIVVDPGLVEVIEVAPRPAPDRPLLDPGCRAAYLRCSSNPWGSFTNQQHMDAVFGFGAWDEFIFPGGSNVFTPGSNYEVAVLDGGDFCANDWANFTNGNRATMEAWVQAGGGLLQNAAPNQGVAPLDMAFGVRNFNYLNGGALSVTGTAINPAHPIFTTPNPAGTFWSGFYFGHGRVDGTGVLGYVPLIRHDIATQQVVGEISRGNGWVVYGEMTTTNFHSPAAQAINLRRNILSYLDSQAECAGGGGGGGDCDLGPIEAKLDDETRFTDDGEFQVALDGIAALEAKADALEVKLDAVGCDLFWLLVPISPQAQGHVKIDSTHPCFVAEEPCIEIVCHFPADNPPHTLDISCSSVPAHLAHGDTLGPCP